MNEREKTIIVGLSGASGVIYGCRLMENLSRAHCQIHVVITLMAQRILAEEMNITELSAQSLLGRACENLTIHANDNLFSPLASGSFPAEAMVICPCSSHSIASIAAGLADTLLLRSAYVTLKQRRRLILAHREIPLTEIDLENMIKITRAGGIICPASPGFYTRPQTITDLVDTVVGRILDLLAIDHNLPIRWAP